MHSLKARVYEQKIISCDDLSVEQAGRWIRDGGEEGGLVFERIGEKHGVWKEWEWKEGKSVLSWKLKA